MLAFFLNIEGSSPFLRVPFLVVFLQWFLKDAPKLLVYLISISAQSSGLPFLILSEHSTLATVFQFSDYLSGEVSVGSCSSICFLLYGGVSKDLGRTAL